MWFVKSNLISAIHIVLFDVTVPERPKLYNYVPVYKFKTKNVLFELSDTTDFSLKITEISYFGMIPLFLWVFVWFESIQFFFLISGSPSWKQGIHIQEKGQSRVQKLSFENWLVF